MREAAPERPPDLEAVDEHGVKDSGSTEEDEEEKVLEVRRETVTSVEVMTELATPTDTGACWEFPTVCLPIRVKELIVSESTICRSCGQLGLRCR